MAVQNRPEYSYSRGIKKRTINHPILQNNYSLVLILKQRRWRCTNPECLYDTSESFKFVNRQRRTTNATDMLIVDAYRNLLETSVSIAKKFHVSDSHAHDVFNRYVKLDRLTLTDAISIDEIFLDMDEHCKYALVIQDFHTGNPIDLLRSRRSNVTEPSCPLWTDYELTCYELEEANSLCHGNWIEIERQYKYIQTLQKILSENDIPYPNEYDFD